MASSLNLSWPLFFGQMALPVFYLSTWIHPPLPAHVCQCSFTGADGRRDGRQHLATRNPLDYAAAYSSPFCLPSSLPLSLLSPIANVVPSGSLFLSLQFC